MNCVLAKIKRLRVKPYKKLISDNSLFESIDINNIDCILYSADHNLDEDSWFIIEDFSNKDFCLDIIKKSPFDSKDYEDLKKDKFKDISHLISVQNEDFYFQKVTPSTFISQKGIFFLGEVAEIEEDNNKLVIKNTPDAIYFKDCNKLIFKNLATISSIFKGINTLYTEATQAEVDSFLNEPFIKLGEEYITTNVSKPNRKRISFAMDALSSLSPENKTDMFNYINTYCGEIDFDVDNEEFQINSDHDLKNLIYGIQERFYTTSFGQEKRLANSIKIMS